MSSFFRRANQLTLTIFVAIGSSVGAQTAELKKDVAVVRGRVTDSDDRPLAEAVVRIVVPSIDLRFFFEESEHRTWTTKTDADGSYSIEIGDIEKETTAAVDILHRGHRRLVGTLMRGGDENEIKLVPGKVVSFDAQLPSSWYFAGQVVDRKGKPIAGASVSSSLSIDGGSAGIERTVSDKEGRFAIYSYEASFFAADPNRGQSTASISFRHDQHIDAELENIEALDVEARDDLRVVMMWGFSIGGTVTRSDGTPAGNQVVSIQIDKPYQWRGTRTDDTGQYHFDGISGGEATLRVMDVAGNQKSIDQWLVTDHDLEKNVSLKPIQSPIAATQNLLGMTLADVTPAVNDAYDLNAARTGGVMIVDPGDQFESLGIGELRSGYVFWMVGNDNVGDLRTMIDFLIQEARSPTTPPDGQGNTSAWIDRETGKSHVRVVYSLNNEHFQGTNTQYMVLTPKQVDELDALQKELNTRSTK